MNKQTLIKLGSFLQTQLNMDPNYKIMELADDSPNTIFLNGYPNANDKVVLQIVGSSEFLEFIWVGYSKRMNILIIKDEV